MARIREPHDDAQVPSTAELLRRYGPPAVLLAAALLFVFQNTNRTTFSYLWFEFSWPLWVMLVVFAAVGAVVASVLGRRRRRRL